MLHNASDLTIHGRTIRDTMERMIKQGYADIAGVSVYHPAEAETILEDRLWEAIQIPMSLFDQRFIIQGTIEKLESHGIHVFVRSVFLQGIVFLDPDEITEPDLERLAVPHIRTLRKISERAGISPGQFAIAFLRDLPGITSLVLGAENPKQVIENAALFETRTLDSAIRLEVETAFSGFDYSGVMAILARTYGRSGQYKK
jgi:aryl-alcohol dehydrogenase-like predicted oxidoreductase